MKPPPGRIADGGFSGMAPFEGPPRIKVSSVSAKPTCDGSDRDAGI